MAQIVVRAPNWLGDVVMSLPFLYELAHLNPGAQLHVILKEEHQPLLKLLPSHISLKVWPFHKREHRGIWSLRRFCRGVKNALDGPVDAYYCLPPSFSAALMGVFLGAKKRMGYPSQARSFLFTHPMTRPQAAHRSREYWALLADHPRCGPAPPTWTPPLLETDVSVPFHSYLVINPNSQASSRRLPLDKWASVAAMFRHQNFALIGGPNEYERVEQLRRILEQQAPQNRYVNMVGKTTVLGLVTLLQQSNGLITNDSGPAHVAHFTGVPTMVLFGAGNVQNTGPSYGPGRALVIDQSLPCAPCLKNTCPLDTLACLADLDFSNWKHDIPSFFAQTEQRETEAAVDKVAL